MQTVSHHTRLKLWALTLWRMWKGSDVKFQHTQGRIIWTMDGLKINAAAVYMKQFDCNWRCRTSSSTKCEVKHDGAAELCQDLDWVTDPLDAKDASLWLSLTHIAHIERHSQSVSFRIMSPHSLEAQSSTRTCRRKQPNNDRSRLHSNQRRNSATSVKSSRPNVRIRGTTPAAERPSPTTASGCCSTPLCNFQRPKMTFKWSQSLFNNVTVFMTQIQTFIHLPSRRGPTYSQWKLENEPKDKNDSCLAT